MFSRKSLLVVGAGASREVKLPTGAELAAQIASLLMFRFDFGQLKEGDPSFLNALRIISGTNDALNAHLVIARQITEGVRLVNSIDNYIDTHRQEPRVASCGKAAIVYSILKAESHSPLRVDSSVHPPRMDFGKLNDTWYREFGRLLVEGVPLAQIETIFNNLTIVCFNYDRCIEEFLAFWLASVYAIDLGNARELVDRLTILRPYGRIAPVQTPREPQAVPFGHNPAYVDLRPLVGNIKTFTEQIEDNELVMRIRSAMSKAETVVFLGFAFHPQNLRLIMPEDGIGARRIFASAYGFSQPDAEDISASLKRHLKNGRATKIAVRNDLTCAGLFNEFRRTLSA